MATDYLPTDPTTFDNLKDDFVVNPKEGLTFVTTRIHHGGGGFSTKAVDAGSSYNPRLRYALVDDDGNLLEMNFDKVGNVTVATRHGGSDVHKIIQAFDVIGDYEEEEFERVFNERFPESGPEDPEPEEPAESGTQARATKVVDSLLGPDS